MGKSKVLIGMVLGLLLWVGNGSAQNRPVEKMENQAKEILKQLDSCLIAQNPDWRLKFKTLDPNPAFNQLTTEVSTNQLRVRVQIMGWDSPEKASEILHGEALYASNGGGQVSLPGFGDEAIASSHWIRVRQGKVLLVVTVYPNSKSPATDSLRAKPKSGGQPDPSATGGTLNEISFLTRKIARYVLVQLEP